MLGFDTLPTLGRKAEYWRTWPAIDFWPSVYPEPRLLIQPYVINYTQPLLFNKIKLADF